MRNNFQGTQGITGFGEGTLFSITFAAAIVAVVLLTFVPLTSNDFLLQVKVGELIWTNHEIPKTLLFPFTEASDFTFHAHEWIPSIIFYLLDDALGQDRLLFVKGAVGLALFGGCYLLVKRWTGDRTVSLYLALLTIAVTNYRYFFRPEIFALIFLLVLIALLIEFRKSGKTLYLFLTLPIYLLWVNCHGSFPVALAVMSIFAVGEAIEAARLASRSTLRSRLSAAVVKGRPYAFFVAAMLAVGLINPEGFRLLLFPATIGQSEAAKLFISEWQPTFSPYFTETLGFYVYVYYVVVCIAFIGMYRKALGATEILMILAFGVLSALRQRYIVFFAYASLYVLATAYGKQVAGAVQRTPLSWLLALILVSIAAMLEHGNAYGAFPYFARSNRFSAPILERLEKTEVRGNVFNSYELGAELIYRYYPKLRPVIDSRIDSYGDQYYLAWRELLSNEEALNDFIKNYDVRYMLLLGNDFSKIRNMQSLQKSGWRMVFADHKMVLLEGPALR